jgi:N-methylhydantoinase B
VVEIKSTPGTVVNCVWPAGVAVGGTFAGQEARTAVNVCITRMLDASEKHAPLAMASCMTSAPGQAISGYRPNGSFFTTTLLDAQGGGAGARSFADGSDVSGPLHAPGGASANVESNEHAYPIRYLWRQERPDSGGPGRLRGGIGSTFAYAPHGARGSVDLTLFAHGVNHPTSSGVLGGEPGTQHGFLILRGEGEVVAWAHDRSPERGDVPAAKSMAHLEAADVMVSWCAGGGGLGDPIDRDPGDVLADVRNGLVTPQGAAGDYGVAVVASDLGELVVDAGATDRMRAGIRHHRLGGRDPLPIVDQVAGRWLGSSFVGVGDGPAARVRCRRCGYDIGPVSVNIRTLLAAEERPVGRRWPLAGRQAHPDRFVVRHYFCPGCAVQVDVEVTLVGEPPLWASELSLEEDRHG